MYVGVAYYPEHWAPSRWETDARLMQAAGINLVRLAEFAWVKMEPAEGRFEFAWLDEAVRVLSKHGIRIILGTPTESMPPWVATRYPHALAEDKTGRRIPYGARRDNCPTSPDYRRLSRAITAAMARHYAGNPALVGWQTDNEFGGPYCYCQTCEAAWREYLRGKYGSLDELNRRWGTIFWGHTYGAWDEIPLPRRDGGNPSLELEFRRFHSRQVVSFQREQVEILRRVAPGPFIAHNMCGFFLDQVNYFDLAADLDIAGLDYYYPNAPWPERFRGATYESQAMDLTRSLKKRNFFVLETPTGPIGGPWYLRNLRPLEMRRMNFMALGHGADGLLWFRWRTCLYGHEQFCHGILGHDGVPGRRYQDVSRVAHEFHALAPHLEGSTVRSDVAIVYSYDNRWAMGVQTNARDFDYFNHLWQYYRALKPLAINVDFVHPGESLDGYRVVVLPAGYILTPDLARRLESFVERGGSLLVTTRSGVKNEDNIPYEMALPGLLADLCGIRMEEYEALLAESPIRFEAAWGGEVAKAYCLADWILPQTARTVARYEEAYLKSFAAVTVNDFGKGRAYYVGTCFVSDETVRLIARHVLKGAGVARPLALPEGVGAVIRRKGADRFLFVMNHNDEAVTLDLAALPACRELISGRAAALDFALGGGDVAVLAYRAGGAAG